MKEIKPYAVITAAGRGKVSQKKFHQEKVKNSF